MGCIIGYERIFTFGDWNVRSIFHIVSCLFEIPSGVAADVSDEKTMVLSQLASLLSSVMMILSKDFLYDGFCYRIECFKL